MDTESGTSRTNGSGHGPTGLQLRAFASFLDSIGVQPTRSDLSELWTSTFGGKRDFFFVPGKGIKDIRHPDAKMVRSERWKLNYYPGNGGELYDLHNDPREERNLFQDPGSQGMVRDLKYALLDWLITADENDQIAPRWLVE